MRGFAPIPDCAGSARDFDFEGVISARSWLGANFCASRKLRWNFSQLLAGHNRIRLRPALLRVHGVQLMRQKPTIGEQFRI